MKKELILYKTTLGKIPFEKWLKSLKDREIRARIRVRLNRLALGHYGDYKQLKKELCELRLDYGPGYRIYFAEVKQEYIVLLLLGGIKKTQDKDIQKALSYWQAFRTRYNHE